MQPATAFATLPRSGSSEVSPVPSMASMKMTLPGACAESSTSAANGTPAVDAERAFGDGVRSARRDGFHDAHRDADGVERARDDPSVATVVARAGDDDDALRQVVGKARGDLGGGCRAGALHERARRDARRNGRSVARRAGGVDDARADDGAVIIQSVNGSRR